MWLLKQEVAAELARIRRAGLMPTAAQCAEFVERQRQTEVQAGVPRNLKIAGDVAEICVEGVLTRKPDFFAWLFGGGNTTYESIQSSLAHVAADGAIKRVVFNVHSPGGHVDGLFETLDAIATFPKQKSVRASMADSAAYAIAAAAGKIEATNPAAEFGSIGVAVAFLNLEELIDITSTEAPDKRPDVTTEEGKAVVRRYLDAIHQLFAEAIARGRGTTVADVNENFGRGAVLLATDAKRRGMVDKIAKPALRAVPVDTSIRDNDYDDDEAQAESTPTARVSDVVTVVLTKSEPSGAPEEAQGSMNASAASGAPQPRKNAMTKEELKAQHPDLYKAVQDEAITGERDRVEAHLHAGEQSGDMKTAHEAIRSGAGMTQTYVSKYMMASMNRRAREDRQSDDAAAATALNGAGNNAANANAAQSDPGAQVAAEVERLMGITPKAVSDNA